MIGYVVAVSPIRKSGANALNRYFDVKMMIAKDKTQDVRVMVVKNNPSISADTFVMKQKASQPIKISNVSEATNGTLFVNSASTVDHVFTYECSFSFDAPIKQPLAKIEDILSHRDGVFNVKGKVTWEGKLRSPSKSSQAIRNALLCDEKASIPLSIWEDHLPKVQNGSFYIFTDMKLHIFKGKVLNTQRCTKITKTDAFEVVKKKMEHPQTICCPDILNGNINIYPICNNPSCHKKITAVPGAKLATCASCNKKLLMKNACIDINVMLQLQSKDATVTNVTIFH